jgi:hypothetical protein
MKPAHQDAIVMREPLERGSALSCGLLGQDTMSHTPPDPSGASGDLRGEIEEKIADLERRLDDVERALAERARQFREARGGTDGEATDIPSGMPDPSSD